MALAGGATAQRNQAEIDLQAAIRAETVNGDLQNAIKAYAAIVSKHKGDRATAATALVRMAECYQKLGDAQAQAIYERVVREYSDQKDAVNQARARLAPEAAVPVVRGDRPVWLGPKAEMSGSGQVSPDGRFITYVDWDLNLTVHDVVTNTDRPLTSTGPAVGFSQEAGFSTISRDGKQVAYAWFNDKSLYDLRILPLQAATQSQPRVLFSGNHDFRDIFPRDWSPDGKFIAVSIRRKDATSQIGLAAVADGSVRVLKSVDWRGANTILFSPDGRWIAYDLPVGDSDEVRSLYVMAVDGSVEHAVVTHPSRNVLMAWTHDGRNILFASDRSGQTALWAQRIAGGKSAGGPAMIKRDIGSSVSLGLTNSGSLYVRKGRSANYVQVANVDFSERRILPSQSGTFQQFIGSGGSPSWSPDGKSLLYGVCRPQAACAIAVGSPESGHVREVRPKMAYLGATRWSADGQSFITDGTDLRGKRALYRINARTGEISFLHERPGAVVQLAPDEKKIYYRVGGSIIERDIVVGSERELFHERAKGNSISIKVSPNGRQIAAVETAGTKQTLYLLPISGDAPIELLRSKSGETLNGFRLEWMPDGRSVILPKVPSPGSPTELWMVPIDSQSAQKLDFHVDGLEPGFAIHPDGRQIAFVAAAGKQDAEVWALENFLPAAGATAR
jgi:Tol biopolymer transport system component